MEGAGPGDGEGLHQHVGLIGSAGVGGVGTVASCDISSAHGWSEQHDHQSGGGIEERVTSVLSAAP